MAIWDDVLTERDKKVFKAAGWGASGGFGERPVILVVDVIYNFCGDEPEPILESIKKYRYSCGAEAWDGIYALQHLISVARPKGVPIIYQTYERREDAFDAGAWNYKNSRALDACDIVGSHGNEIVKEVAPEDYDIVFCKKKPSSFFHTPLELYLNSLKADTIIVTGTTTSGCVRATAVDAFQYNYHTIVPIETCWDRGQTSHKMNLFDLSQKYAEVLPVAEVEEYIRNLPEGLFADTWPPAAKLLEKK
jgi:maleamate amidohydrolase